MRKIHMLDDRFTDLSSELPYRHFIAPGVVLLDDDDAMMAIIEYSGRDQSVMSDDDLDATSARVSNLLAKLGAGDIVLHFEVQKRKAAGYPVTSERYAVSSLLDAKRRQRMNVSGTQYKFQTYLSITYTPPTVKARRVTRFFFRSPEDQTRQYYADHVEPFRQLVSNLAGHLNSALGYARLLNDDEVMTAIYNVVDPEGQHFVKAPTLPGFPIKHALGTLGMVPGKPMWRTNGNPDEEYFVKVFGMSGYPTVSDSGMLAALQEAASEFRLSFRFECLDEVTAENVLKWTFRSHDETALDWRSYLERLSGVGELRNDPVAMMRAMDAEAARVEAVEPGVVTGFLSITGVVWGRTKKEADEAYDAVSKRIQPKGFTLKDEGWNSDLAFLGSLYGHTRPNARRVPLPNTVLSDMVLLSSPWTGCNPNDHYKYDALMRLDSDGGAGVNVDIFDGKDGSAALIGPQRQGKSTALSLIGHQLLARIQSDDPANRPRVVWIDADSKLSTSMVATWMAGGEFLSFDAGDMALQPLARLDGDGGDAWGKKFAMAVWDRLGVIGPDMPYDRVLTLTTDALNILRRSPVHERTLSGLADVIQSVSLRNTLRSHFTRGSTFGHLLDADHDRIQDADWITVDLAKLMDEAEEMDVKLVVMALFRRFYTMFEDLRPTLFIVDEFKQMGAIYDELDEIRRRGPKRRVCMVMAAHKVEDMKSSSIWPILKTTKAHFFFGDVAAPKSEILTTDFDVSVTERQRIAEAGQRGEMGWTLYKNKEGSRVVKFELTDFEKAVCGCGAGDMVAAREIYRRVGPAGFPAAWLEHKGLDADAETIRNEMMGEVRYDQAAE